MAERDALSRASVYCNDPDTRNEMCGVVKWLDQVLGGMLQARYEAQARAKLGIQEPEPPMGAPQAGSYTPEDEWEPTRN